MSVPDRADQLGFQRAIVGQRHLDGVGLLDHVIVGEDVALGASTITPEPIAIASRSCGCCSSGTPKKRRKNGSCSSGLHFDLAV